MKTIVLLVFATFLLTPICFAQNISGDWYGIGTIAKSGAHNSYLSELLIKRRGNKVTGEFNYYYRSNLIKTKVTGTYNAATRELLLTAQPILAYKSLNVNGADCPMEGSFTLRISKGDTSFTGQFNPVFSYRYTCPAINATLVKQKPEEKIFTTPHATEIPAEEIEPPVEVKKEDPNQKIIDKLNERAFETNTVIEVDADSLKISLYDNGEVDNDTISVFYNRKLVAYKKMLTDKPLNITLPLDTAVNEIAMYAENLGSIPPNTALCLVYAGDKRFELVMSSSFIKNSAIRFRKKQKTAGQ